MFQWTACVGTINHDAVPPSQTHPINYAHGFLAPCFCCDYIILVNSHIIHDYFNGIGQWWECINASEVILPLQRRHIERDGVSNHQPRDCLLNCLFRHRSKKTSKVRVTGLCAGNSPVTGEFPAQMASNADIISIWWRHHENMCTIDQFQTTTNYNKPRIECVYLGVYVTHTDNIYIRHAATQCSSGVKV